MRCPALSLLLVTTPLLAGCGEDAPTPVSEATERVAEPPPPEPPSADAYGAYTNPRFGFTVVYPNGLLAPVWPEEDAQSRGFLAVAPNAALRAYGRELRPGQSLAGLRGRTTASYDTVAYAIDRDSAFVVSGYRDGRVAYTKVVRRGAVTLTLELEYEADVRTTYDRVVERAAPPFPDGAQPAPAPVFAVYQDPRLGFGLVYPPAELTPDPPIGDARTFRAADGSALLRAVRAPVGDGLDGARRRLAAAMDTVTYAADLRTGFVLSGYRRGRIVYAKVVRRAGALLSMELSYDAERRSTFDPVVERMARSFPVGAH